MRVARTKISLGEGFATDGDTYAAPRQSDDRALPGAPGVGSHATGERSLAGQWLPFVHLACLLRLRLIGPCLPVPRGHAALDAVALRLPLVCLHTALHAGAAVAATTPLASAALYCPPPTHPHPRTRNDVVVVDVRASACGVHSLARWSRSTASPSETATACARTARMSRVWPASSAACTACTSRRARWRGWSWGVGCLWRRCMQHGSQALIVCAQHVPDL